MPINLYHTQRIRGFQQVKEIYSPKSLIVKLKRTKFNCRTCGSERLTATAIKATPSPWSTYGRMPQSCLYLLNPSG